MKLSELAKRVKGIKIGDIVRYWYVCDGNPRWIYIKIVKIKDDSIAGYGVDRPEDCLNTDEIGQWQPMKICEIYEVK